MSILNFWKKRVSPEQITWQQVNPSLSSKATSLPPLSPAYKSKQRVFTSGQVGTDAQGKLSSDIVEQTENCCLNMQRILETTGSSMYKVVKVLLFIKRREDAAVVNEIYQTKFGNAPPARSAILCDFPNPNVLVEFEVIATVDPSLQPVSWEQINEPALKFLSPGFKAHGLVHTSGQVGFDSNGDLPSDIAEQTINAIENVSKVLKAGGSSLDNSLKVLFFISKREYASIVNKIYPKYFKNKPARSLIIVDFPNSDIGVELEVIASSAASPSPVRQITWEDIGSSGNNLLSPAYATRDLVFTSGQLGTDSTGKLPANCIAQTENALKNVIKVLEASGSSIDKSLKVLLLIKNREDVSAINEVYAKYFTTKPARSAILVGFPNPNVLVEIEVVAEVDSTKSKL
ncbi:unnamed protein product [Cyberlindnera jadinii]|uniref:YjgF-like protein n=1 Tax=Cyberlindnera jadinii (strain ATCC 18201 / CBS 1600 / BCRC 20928 / JCM 3617 / NBRC 0987 / NRRL Y-1542) TaxID=983966 RepID=A0A0H5C575_CYBJN|nr:unnamed protein product [Cyberlindnera jadinii]